VNGIDLSKRVAVGLLRPGDVFRHPTWIGQCLVTSPPRDNTIGNYWVVQVRSVIASGQGLLGDELTLHFIAGSTVVPVPDPLDGVPR
jgi:hypothetical protein